jgi:Transposase DDE domain group 1
MNSTPEQLRFASIPGCTIRADFAGGGLSSDLGRQLVKGVDRQISQTERVCAALNNTHTLHDIIKQRIYQIASGYEDDEPPCSAHNAGGSSERLADNADGGGVSTVMQFDQFRQVLTICD